MSSVFQAVSIKTADFDIETKGIVIGGLAITPNWDLDTHELSLNQWAIVHLQSGRKLNIEPFYGQECAVLCVMALNRIFDWRESAPFDDAVFIDQIWDILFEYDLRDLAEYRSSLESVGNLANKTL